jgi:hypothetical protein
MRALLFAFLLALATVVPAFADGGSELRPPATDTVDVGGPAAWGP